MTQAQHRLLAIGSYTPDDEASTGGPAGLTTWWWDGATAVRAAGEADLASPSFVCWHPTLPLLYAVSELDDGELVILAVDGDGGLRDVARLPTGGAQPCWVGTDPGASLLVVANYDVDHGASTLMVVALGVDGLPAGQPVVVPHHGSGPVAGRQDAAHVHQVVVAGDGALLAVDLGTDAITAYRAAPDGDALSVVAVGTCPLPLGTGPRHVALSADGLAGFVTGELNATVTPIRQHPDPIGGPAQWRADDSVPCTTRTDVPTGEIYPSQVLLADERWLLVANRGTNTLAVLDTSADLTIVDEIEVGAWPRHFTIVGDVVLVACQRSDEVRALRLDLATGALAHLGALGTPAGLAALRTPSVVALRP